MPPRPSEAGKGEHHVYRIPGPDNQDKDPLQAGRHYLGVDAVAWYINKESTWLRDRMASGALDIKLSGGLEKYQAALGTYELKSGARVAPVFERPVLPDRNFVGGPITFNAFLTAIKKDTVLGGMLKSAASASLGIVAGMVQTATVAGPAKLLSAAGEDLIGGVRKVLSETGEKREPIFDFSGIEFNIQPQHVVGPEMFVLLHRGAALPQDQLRIGTSGELLLPFLGDQMLIDGAWILLRLRRSSTYSGVRDWFERVKQLRNKIRALIADVTSGAREKEAALKLLKPSDTGDTLFDEFARLRAIIFTDGVLSETEASARVGEMDAALAAARKAITAQEPGAFDTAMAELSETLARGGQPKGAVGRAFTTGVASVLDSRRALTVAMAKGAQEGRRGARVPAASRLQVADVMADTRVLSDVMEASFASPGSKSGTRAAATTRSGSGRSRGAAGGGVAALAEGGRTRSGSGGKATLKSGEVGSRSGARSGASKSAGSRGGTRGGSSGRGGGGGGKS